MLFSIFIIYALLFLIALFFDRFLQMVMFVLFFEFIQSCFLKRFHANQLFDNEPIKAVNLCKMITFLIQILYLIFCKRLILSIYFNVFIIFVVATLNALLGFYVERTICFKSKLNNIETLIPLCEEAKLTPLATKRMIMRYVERKTLKEIASIECVEEESIKKEFKRYRKKLKLNK